MKLSVRIEKAKNLDGQTKHDFYERPTYSDASRLHLNKTIIGGSYSDIKAKIKEQSEQIIESYNLKAKEKRDSANTPEEKRRISSWRKNTATHKTAIITFDSEFHKKQDSINRKDLDTCASNFLKDFCLRNNCEVTYLVRHDDESTAHYHATFTNINKETLKPLRFQKKDTSLLQDLAGDHFKSMGISRGVKISEKLGIAKLNNPILENESQKEYENRIYKLAGVIHKNVKQLHEELPLEIEKKKAEIRALKSELNELKRSPIKGDIARTYNVVIGDNFLNKKVKKMELVEPVKYKNLIKKLNVKSKENSENSSLLKLKFSTLKNIEDKLNRDKSCFEKLLDDRVNNYINDNAVIIKNKIMIKSKLILKDAFIKTADYMQQIEASEEIVEEFDSKVIEEIEQEIGGYNF